MIIFGLFLSTLSFFLVFSSSWEVVLRWLYNYIRWLKVVSGSIPIEFLIASVTDAFSAVFVVSSGNKSGPVLVCVNSMFLFVSFWWFLSQWSPKSEVKGAALVVGATESRGNCRDLTKSEGGLNVEEAGTNCGDWGSRGQNEGQQNIMASICPSVKADLNLCNKNFLLSPYLKKLADYFGEREQLPT